MLEMTSKTGFPLFEGQLQTVGYSPRWCLCVFRGAVASKGAVGAGTWCAQSGSLQQPPNYLPMAEVWLSAKLPVKSCTIMLSIQFHPRGIYIHIYVHIGSYMYAYSHLLKAWSFGEMLRTKVMIWRGLERLWGKAMGKKILSLFPSPLLIQLISSASTLYFNTLISSSVPAGSHRADEQLLICTDTFLCYYLNGIVADWLTRG